MKRVLFLLALVVFALSAVTASAASTPFSWTGVYAGVEGGYAFGHDDWTYMPPQSNFQTADHNIHGGLGGLFLGANRQFSNNIVLGLEANADIASIKGDADCPNNSWTCSSKANWIGSARLRAGYAIDRFLPYVAVGAGFSTLDTKTIIKSTGQEFGGSNILTGWTTGVGLEYAITNNISARGEYDYYGFRKQFTAVDNGLVVENKIHLNVFKLGIAYKF